MWEKLKSEQKEKYKALITNFASLSEAFSQKSELAKQKKYKTMLHQLSTQNFKKQYFRGLSVQ